MNHDGLAKYLSLIVKLDDFSNLRWVLKILHGFSFCQTLFLILQAQSVGKIQPGAQLMQYSLKLLSSIILWPGNTADSCGLKEEYCVNSQLWTWKQILKLSCATLT